MMIKDHNSDTVQHTVLADLVTSQVFSKLIKFVAGFNLIW